MAGVEPIFEVVTGTFKVQQARIISLNKERRHMTEAQWGMTAAKLANISPEDTKANLKQHRRLPAVSGEVEPISLQDAAKEVGVSRSTVISCRKVLREGVPELIKAVEAGEIKAKPAERIASLPKKEQPKAIERSSTKH